MAFTETSGELVRNKSGLTPNLSARRWCQFKMINNRLQWRAFNYTTMKFQISQHWLNSTHGGTVSVSMYFIQVETSVSAQHFSGQFNVLFIQVRVLDCMKLCGSKLVQRQSEWTLLSHSRCNMIQPFQTLSVMFTES